MSSQKPKVEIVDTEIEVSSTEQAAPSKTVKIGKVPGEIHEVTVTEGDTIKDLFKKLDIDISRCQIQQNGCQVQASELAKENDVILAVAKIRGNPHYASVSRHK